MFLVYINDIVDVVNSEIRLFADDTTVFVFVDNPVASARKLNNDLSKMNDWVNQWLVNFSHPKTKCMTISWTKRKVPHPPLEMGGIVIDEVDHFKHLSVTIQDDLSWDKHVSNIIIKANKKLDIMLSLKYKLDRA